MVQHASMTTIGSPSSTPLRGALALASMSHHASTRDPVEVGVPGARRVVEAVLEAIAGPAAILHRAQTQYIVLQMNAAAERENRCDPGAVVDGVRRALEAREGPWRVTLVDFGDESREVYLAMRPIGRHDPEPRLSDWVRRLELSARKAAVLLHLSRGESNKEIACALGCAENTVELHVTGLLRATGFSSRTELIARFWTDET